MASDKPNQRILLVDPNPKNHESVDISNLSILVELETFKKPRSVISVEEDGNKLINVNNTKTSVKIIDGTQVGKKKQLTTNYTEINTTFNKDGNDLETMGITNIEIEFNSSYTPMITIDLVDIRGNSMFEKGAESKYSVFFDMPHPIFRLTIKGFYGKTITYCLNMVKWKGVFNQNTGNFEIKCEFVGYTYAFLTDMLMGYLKGVTMTDEGMTLLKGYSLSDGSPVPSLVKFFEEITKLNDSLGKMDSDDESIKRLKRGTLVIKHYDELLSAFSKYTSELGSNVRVGRNEISGFVVLENDATKINDILTIKNSNEVVINSLIEENNLILNEETFKVKKIENILGFITSKELYNDGINDNSKYTKNLDLFFQQYTIDPTKMLYILDYTEWVKDVKDKIQKVKEANKITSEEISKNLTTLVPEKIGFKPTIRNIFTILCVHAEILLKLIEGVAKNVEANKSREAEFKQYLLDSDIQPNSPIHPFPVFAENKQEKWMGSTLDTEETQFIDKLLDGMLKAKAAEDNILSQSENYNKDWVPINVLDSKLGFNYVNPYIQIGNSGQISDFLKLATFRGVIFLGYSSSNLSDSEIQAMAKFEANNLYKSIINDTIKSVLVKTFTSGDIFINNLLGSGVKGTPSTKLYIDNFKLNNNATGKVLSESNSSNIYYEYSYLQNTTTSFIPLNINEKIIVDSTGYFNENILINNKIPYISTNSAVVKILDEQNYKSGDFHSYIDEIFTSDKLVSESNLSSDVLNGDFTRTTNNSSDYNQFAGNYKTQEFFKIDDDSSHIKFYKDVDNYGLALDVTDKLYPTKYDLNGNTVSNVANITEVNDELVDRDESSDRNLGETIDILSSGNNVEAYFPYIDFKVHNSNLSSAPNMTFSLFGSEFYYKQTSNKAKAFLFLHTLPINNDNGVLSDKIISSLFDRRAGFIRLPKIWTLFIGGLLWRYKETTEPIVFNIPGNFDSSVKKPSKIQYLKYDSKPMGFSNEKGCFFIEDAILNLPTSVKNEFIDKFEEWVDEDGGWNSIREGLELISEKAVDTGGISSLWNNFFQYPTNKTTTKNYILNYNYNGVYVVKNLDNFVTVNKLTVDNPSDYQLPGQNMYLSGEFYIQHKGGTDSMKSLVNLLFTNNVLLNSTWRIWGDKLGYLNKTQNILINKDNTKVYFNTLFKTLVDIHTNAEKDKAKVNTRQALFQTIDDENIKLSLYRGIKSIFDKWISGCEDTLSQCIGFGTAEFQKRDTSNTGRLSKSFHFVSKSMQDIGDDFFINPFGVSDFISKDINQSLYDVISRILTDNHFNFVSLPSFINYLDYQTLKESFDPYSYNNVHSMDGAYGPSFVCTYVDTKSVNLDLGDNSLFPDDGVQIDSTFVNTPPSFSENYRAGKNDLTIPIFAVNYADDNQSMFKNMKLNQEAFSETAETLRTVDDIAQGGNPNNRSYIGQNLFNVYDKRSYQVEIDSLGNAMIQPMMYFQLNSVPMFHGTYLITKVRHSISPGNMTTTFKGVRIGKRDLPLITESTTYMNLIPNSEDGDNVDKGKISSLSSDVANATPTLTKTQTNNVQLLKNALIGRGIVNKNLLAAIISVIYEESGLLPVESKLNYSVDNLLRLFPKIFQTRAEAESVVGNKELIAEKLFPIGGGTGNKEKGDPLKYIPRGFNQITGRATYQEVKDGIKKDVITNPNLLVTDINVSVDAAAYFFDYGFTKYKKTIYKDFNISSVQDIDNKVDAVKVAIQTNAGFGKNNKLAVNAEVQDAYKKALSYFSYFLSQVS